MLNVFMDIVIFMYVSLQRYQDLQRSRDILQTTVDVESAQNSFRWMKKRPHSYIAPDKVHAFFALPCIDAQHGGGQ